MIVKLHSKFEDCTTFRSKNNKKKHPEKRDFLSPMNLIEKWLT